MTDKEQRVARRERFRAIFEQKLKTANERGIIGRFDLAQLQVNGKFNRYMDPDTDNAWIGFLFGVDAGMAAAVEAMRGSPEVESDADADADDSDNATPAAKRAY